MAVRIITDSAADYSQAEIEKRKITCVPMSVSFGTESFLDGKELTKEEFYERLMEGEYFPQTAQPSPASFLDAFEDAKEAGDSVVVILIASVLSGTYQTAHLAKDMAEYDDIYIIDSKTATLGMRILVDRAVMLRDRGKDAREIVKEIEALIPRIRIYAGLDTLEYLFKGGRISRAAASIGKMANLKPIILLDAEGHVCVCGKQIGNRHACKAITKLVEENEIDDAYPIYFVYSYDKKNAALLAHTLEKNELMIGEAKFREIGPTIGTHIGPGAYGIVYVGKTEVGASKEEPQQEEE